MVILDCHLTAQSRRVGREMSMKAPALATVAVDDIAQPPIYPILDRAAQTPTGV
jgi:hypothetical protein